MTLARNSIEGANFLRFKEDEDFKSLGELGVWRTLDVEEPPAQAAKPGKDVKVRYRVTDRTLASLREAGMSQVMLSKLKALKEREFETQEIFLKELATILPADERDRFQPLALSQAEVKADPTRVLLRYSNGKPALVSRTVDSGEVLLVATAAEPGLNPGATEPTWSDLPLWFGYVPFIEASLNHLGHRQTQNHNLTAGETLRWHPDPRDAGRSFALEYPPTQPNEDGKRGPLGRPDTGQGHPVLTATGLHRAGIYHLTAADRGDGGTTQQGGAAPAPPKKFQPLPFAVVPDLRESASLETLSDGQIDELLGFRPIHLKSDGNVNVTAETERTNREWTLWLLAAVLVLAVCETVLAWFCGRAW
jgi:hypothetical protein